MLQGAPVPEKLATGQINAQKGSSKGSQPNAPAQATTTTQVKEPSNTNKANQEKVTEQPPKAPEPQKQISMVQDDVTAPNTNDQEYLQTNQKDVDEEQSYQNLA